MRAVLLLVLALPVSAQAALPSTHSLGRVIPTPSGIVNSKYRNGDDGTTAIPLLWGTCPALSTNAGASDSFNLRTLCSLQEAGSPTATLSLLSGTLPTGCVMATDGIACTTPTAGSASVTIRATRNAATADAGVSITVTTAGTDSTAPTIPLGLTSTDNADGTGSLTWDAASDPNVSGIATGVASYRVQLGGVTQATVTAPSANVQPALTQTRIGAADSEASSQAGADWTLTFGGAGLASTADHILGRFATVTGDFTATMKVTSFTPVSGTTGSIGIAARASADAGAIAAYARWRDSDDKCNLRYRGTTGGAAANGTVSSAYTLPVWIKMTRASDTFTAYCSTDGNTWTATSSVSVSPGATAYVGPFVTNGTASSTATGIAAQFNVHQGAQVSHTISSSGSYTVSSYDGTNRSSESVAVVAQLTGAPAAGVPTKFVVTRPTSTTATIEWKAPETGGSVTEYRLYMASSENGTYSNVWTGLPTPDANLGTYSYTHSSGISAGAEPWFKLTAVAGAESSYTTARKLSIGAVTLYGDSVAAFPNNSSSTAPSATALFSGVSSTSTDAFGSVDYNANPDAVGGDLGMRLVKNRLFGGKWATRAQVTFHTYGSNSPSDGVSANSTYSGVTWQTKGDGGGDKAHRNEFAFATSSGFDDITLEEEHWMGFAVYLPGEADSLGDAPSRAYAGVPGNYLYGPQLHLLNISGQPGFTPAIPMSAGVGGYGSYGTTYGTNHPSGAPVVRFKRGGEEPLGSVSSGTLGATVSHTASKSSGPDTLYVEWDPVVGASSYRVETAWRPEGVWSTASTSGVNNITVDTANRRVIATGLGTYTTCFTNYSNCTTRYIRVVPVIGGSDGTTSLISPAPRWHWSWGGGFSIDARPDYGSWVRWVARYKLSDSGTGYMEVWKDDVKVSSQFNLTFGNENPAADLYWKIGFYTGHPGGAYNQPALPMDWPWRRIVYFDEVRGAQRTGGASTPTDANDSAYQLVRPRGPAGE